MKSLPQLLLTTALLASSAFAADATTQEPPAPKKKVAFVRLSNQLAERPRGFHFSLFDMSGAKPPALSSLITTLNKAAKDTSINAVVLDLNGFSLTLSQAQELGALVQNLKKSQKLVAFYASDYTTPTYVLASNASLITMPENGNILMPGVTMNMMFFRGLLDKLSITPDFVQVGKFKGAEEPFTRTEASPEYKAQIDGLVSGFYEQIKTSVVKNRPNLTAEEVTKAIDEGWLTGKRARELKLVDRTMSRDKLDGWLKETLGEDFEALQDYGSPKRKSVDFDSPLAIFQLFAPPKVAAKSKDPAIALLVAQGTIMPDFPDGADQSDEYVTPSNIRKAVDKALKDPLVKAIVLRVDSPGGSAAASDEIWQILKDADKIKPVTVSQGRVAASGGYYISCAGRSITADSATITGSIGVVGGKMVLRGMLDKVGVNLQNVSRGKHANLFSMTSTFSEEEKHFIHKQMSEVYDLFKKRVAAGRGAKIKEIEDVAGGRLFTGEAALKAGLVDKVGTLSETVHAAAKAAGVENAYQILVYPEPKSFADVLREGLFAEASLPTDLRLILQAAPRGYRQQILQAIDLLRCLQQERVMMAAPGLAEGQ